MKKRFEQLAATTAPPPAAKPSSLSLPRGDDRGRPLGGRERALSNDGGRSAAREEEGGGVQEARGGPARPGVFRQRSSSGPPSRMEKRQEKDTEEEEQILRGWPSQPNLKIAPNVPSNASKPGLSSSRQGSFSSTPKPPLVPSVSKLSQKLPPPVPPLATRPAPVSAPTSSYRKAPAPPASRKAVAPSVPQEGGPPDTRKEAPGRSSSLAPAGSVKLLAAKLVVRFLIHSMCLY